MADLYLPNKPLDETKIAIKKHYDRNTPRPHLGCSEIGKECRAELFHSFRWSVKSEFDAETHLRFLDGHRSEDVMAQYLMMSGVNLYTHGKDGKQFGVSILGGHFAGSMDGLIYGGLPWHKKRNELTVWEHKAVNDGKFNKLIKLVNELGPDGKISALREWDEVYYAQAQMYMHLSGAKSHWLTCSTAGCRDFTGVATKYNQDVAEALVAKAETVITAHDCPAHAYGDPSFFKAKFLNARDLIYLDKVPAPNARNSLFSFPIVDDSNDAVWWDDYDSQPIPLECQEKAPQFHLWNPTFIPYARCVKLDDRAQPRYAIYELDDGTQFYNCQYGMEGKGAYNSTEMQFLTPDLIKDRNIETLRKGFGGLVTGD